MPLSLAIIGFRHGHIYDLAQRAATHPGLNLVAVCEEHEETRETLKEHNLSDRVFASYEEMLDSVPCDVIGVGDYFAIRGARVIEALRRGKHVISDKPICTSLEELDTISELVRESGLRLGCQLDIRDAGNFRALRDIVRSGELGEIRAISFGGQHPINKGKRPGWYFEPGKHGGTLNDVAIHAFDFVPWLTGHAYSSVNCARVANIDFPEVPHFQNMAQIMLTLENGCGVMGDVSYFIPDSHGFALPHYWRTTVWGARGVAETSVSASGVTVSLDGDETRTVPAATAAPGGYIDHFLAEVAGETLDDHLTTEVILRASRVSLLAQHAADNGLCNVSLSEA